MVDNKSKTSLIGHMQKNILLMKINNIILVLCIRIILLSLFMIYFFCIMSLGKFSYYSSSHVILAHSRNRPSKYKD